MARWRLAGAVLAMAVSAGLWAEAASAAEAAKAPPAKRQTWDEMMTVDKDAPVEDLGPVADADARQKAFAARHSAENVERLAQQLFALWDFGERRASRNPMTQRLESEKAQAVKLFQDKKYEDALKAYRTYLVHKAQILWNTKPIFVSGNFEGRFTSPVVKNRYEDVAALLMQDRYQTTVTKKTVRLGEPGLMHWEWKPAEVQNLWDNFKRPEIEFFGGSDYDKLWWKFVDTHDRKYLDKWVALADDYAMNHRLAEGLNSLNLDLGKNGVWEPACFLHALLEISRATPEGDEAVPATTVARLLVKELTAILPEALFYNRQQSNNHSPGTASGLLRVSEFLFDFRLARTIEVEARRQFETYGTVDARPDGAGPGRLPMYALFEFKENQPILDKFRTEDQEWFTPELGREYRDRMLLRARYMMHMFGPTGELIPTQKTDRHTGPFTEYVTYFNRMLPELFDEPDMAAMAARIVRNQTRPSWEGRVYVSKENPLAEMGLGAAGAEEPEVTSLSYPFDRVHIMMNGWDPKRDQIGVFLGSTVRGYGDSFMKENKAANHFNLTAYDRDLFMNGVDYAYNYLSSPVLVDGEQQFNGAGEGPTSRRGGGNYGFDPIGRDRIYYGPDLDVAEGFYDGAYATTGDHNPDYYDYKNKLDALKRSIRGVSHRRVVQFVRKHGLWIVTDLMKSEKPHGYAQQWWLWKQNKQFPDGFNEEDIRVTQDPPSLRSNVPGRVNFSMVHLGPAELDQPAAGKIQYDPIGLKPEWVDTFTGQRSDRLEGREFVQLRGSWKSPGGRSQVITVIYPRKTVDEDLVQIVPLKREDGQVGGFTARLKDGAEIAYAASMEKPAPIAAGGLKATAEALLVVKEADGRRTGAVLGCQSMQWGGPKAATADYTFASAGWSFDTRPIYRPIEPVAIEPGRNAFVDTIDVTMKTPTEGTEIRYTVDGSDPTLASRLYTGPVTCTDSRMLKARAFRKGLAKMPPPTPTGTEMTGVATAVFTKVELHDPNTWTKDPKPGLAFEYYEGKWVDLLFGPNRSLAPLKKGAAEGLFDVAAKTDTKDQAFAFVWDGYLDVPADGVYTLYAPAEFTMYRPLAGYDLSVSLGYRNSYNEGKKQSPGGGTPREAWYPATRRHAFGTWSIALRKGLQPIRVYYADLRPGGTLQYQQFEYPGWNVPGLTKIVWDGAAPQLDISGPGLERQAIPKAWFKRD